MTIEEAWIVIILFIFLSILYFGVGDLLDRVKKIEADIKVLMERTRDRS